MTKLLRYLSFSLFVSFASLAQTGTCGNPLVITLPFKTTDNTSIYGDYYDGVQSGTCGAVPSSTNYLAGNEVFYKFTADFSGNVSVWLDGVQNNASVFVYQGCPQDGATCIAGMANSSANARQVYFFAQQGVSYSIVVSSSAVTQQVEYSLVVQRNDCPESTPTQLSASALTPTSATLSWSSFFASSWEIALQSAGSDMPQGAGTYSSQTAETVSGLDPGEDYQFWVRATCNDAAGFSGWAGPFLFTTPLCSDAEKCNYTFRMTDSANNGWNGARMQIIQNDVVIATIGATYTQGAGPVDVTVPLCDDSPFQINWSVAGTQPQQCKLQTQNSFGQVIQNLPAGSYSEPGIVYSGMVECDTPTCNALVNTVSLTNVVPTGATVTWTSPGVNAWDVYVATAEMPWPSAFTAPTYADVQTNPFTTTLPLEQETSYNVCVRIHCDTPTQWTCTPFTTGAICPKPTQASVSATTTNAATFNWSAGTPSTDTNWEILLIPSITTPAAPSANPTQGTIHPVSLPLSGQGTYSATFSFLTPATIYYAYFRTVCAPDVKSNWTGPVVFNTVTCDAANKCTYKFIMTDSGSNGWNGGRLQVRQNGIVVSTVGASITGAGPTTVSAQLCNNVPFDLFWSVEGTSPEEIGVSIVGPYNDTLFTLNPGTNLFGQSIYAGTGSCDLPACVKPIPSGASEITTTSAVLSWTEGNESTVAEVYVVPFGAPAPVNGSPISDVAPHYVTTSMPYMVNGLTPGQKYTYYVRSICPGNITSTWSILEAQSFKTKPVNDECGNALVLPVNGPACSSSTTGATIGATSSGPIVAGTYCGISDDDVWYSFTATAATHSITVGNPVFESTTQATLNVTVFSGSCGDTLTKLVCGGAPVTIVNGLTPGHVYYVRAYTSSAGQATSFSICVGTPEAVVNDECANALSLTVPTSVDSEPEWSHITFDAASPSLPAPGCYTNTAKDVWFKFVPSATSLNLMMTNIINNTQPVYIALYGGSCGTLAPVSCQVINVPQGIGNQLFENLVIGWTYYLRIWTVSSDVPVSCDIALQAVAMPLNVVTSMTPVQLVEEVLLGSNPCTTVSNITANAGTNNAGLGYFTSPMNSNITIPSGIILSTGSALQASGTNTSTLNFDNGALGDTDLNSVAAGLNSKNATKLEFDFTTVNETMSFNYFFASEEYGEFQCGFTDSFAFLLTDLVTNVTTNLAVIPGTNTPVTIFTLRDDAYNDACSSVNPEYFGMYYGDDFGNPLATSINFNGVTNLMTASSPVIPNHPYHIKLVVADHNDTQYDTAVFISGGNFTAGPPSCLDKIQLNAFLDLNSNGIKDAGESAFNQGHFTMQQNNSGPVNNISTPIGIYTVYDDNPSNVYDFGYVVDAEMQAFFSGPASAFDNVNIPAGSGTQILYFPVTIAQPFNDVTVAMTSMSSPRAGSLNDIHLSYRNNGVATTSGTITYTKDPAVTLQNVAGAVMTPTGFTYNYSDLQPLESRYMVVTQSVPPIPTVNIGDLLENSVSISGQNTDINVNNNSFSENSVVVAAYDPNDKMESHGGKIAVSQFSPADYMVYTVRFQNTGTADALTVRIEDVLDAQLDPNSIRMLSASHNYVMERVGNHVTWTFDYIMLPGIYENEELSKGYVTFAIKPFAGVSVGDMIPNTAAIYFDSNPAIVTNTFNTEFVTTLGVGGLTENNFSIFPNPASEQVTILLQGSAQLIEDVTIFDMIGKKVFERKSLETNQTSLSLSTFSKGVYMVEIATDGGFRVTRKLVVK